MNNFSAYWGTERIVGAPHTPEEWERVWGAIRAVCRPRSGEREGCLYTNHQGLVAVKAIIHMLEKRPLTNIHWTDGITLSRRLAFLVAEGLQDEAKYWSGAARRNMEELSDVTAEALADALSKNRKAVAIVDTSSPPLGRPPALWYEKYKARHEAAHVWQFTVNPRNTGLISEEKMMADPEYPVLAQRLGNYYEEMSPPHIYSEATAHAVAGAGWKVGLRTRARSEAFLERFFREVKLTYGEESLDMLHLVHPHVRKVLDYVRSVERDVGRGEERTSGKDVESGSRGIADPGGTGEQTAGGGLRDAGSPGSLGERRHDDTEDEVNTRQGIRFIGTGGFDSDGRLGGKIAVETDRKGGRALADLTSALEKIAAIESSDPSGARSWRDLGVSAVEIAREAVAGFKQAEEGKVSSALLEIAEMGSVNAAGARRSWKDVTVAAVETARAALEAISQGAHVGTDVAMGAAEAAREVRSNGRAPSQGMSW
jgi:hypothetical protein